MIQNPIHKALLTFQNCDVRYLLMGGQACILYGGAEFSRDIDFSIGIDTKNILAVKKAQREKDWPMIRRLIETDITQGYRKAGKEKIIFWLMECRTPVLLMEIARKNAVLCKSLIPTRYLLKAVLDQNVVEIESLLIQEESAEKKKDREYWLPLRKELEQWRLGRKS